MGGRICLRYHATTAKSGSGVHLHGFDEDTTFAIVDVRATGWPSTIPARTILVLMTLGDRRSVDGLF
jgi:hypothetical protein